MTLWVGLGVFSWKKSTHFTLKILSAQKACLSATRSANNPEDVEKHDRQCCKKRKSNIKLKLCWKKLRYMVWFDIHTLGKQFRVAFSSRLFSWLPPGNANCDGASINFIAFNFIVGPRASPRGQVYWLGGEGFGTGKWIKLTPLMEMD